MSAQHTPTVRRLFDLPLGSHFRYQGGDKVYVLLSYADCGLIGDAPSKEGHRPFQGLYSAAESRNEFEVMSVEFVPVFEAAQRDELPAALEKLLPAYRRRAGLIDPNQQDAYTVDAHNCITKVKGGAA